MMVSQTVQERHKQTDPQTDATENNPPARPARVVKCVKIRECFPNKRSK